MKNLYFLIFFSFFQTIVNAQFYNWSAALGGSESDEGRSIDIDNNGDVITAGTFESTVDFDRGQGVSNLTSAGQQDVFVLKTDAAGNYKWAKRIGGVEGNYVSTVKTDLQNNVFITGYFLGAMDFDPGAGSDLRTSNGSEDVFIIKLDSSGVYQWGIQYGSSGSDKSIDLVISSNQNVVVAGFYTGTINFGQGVGSAPTLTSIGGREVFIAFISNDGIPEAAVDIGGPGDINPISIELDNNDNLFLTGSFSGTCHFNPLTTTTTTSIATVEGFLLKLNGGANFGWVKRMGGAIGSECRGNNLVLTNNGDIAITGSFKGTVDFNPGVLQFNLTAYGTSEDLFIGRLNANGDLLWAQKANQIDLNDGPDKGISIVEDFDGNLIIGGIYWGSLDFDQTNAIESLTSQGANDIFILKLTSAGSFVWINTYGGVNYEIMNDLVITADGQTIMTGYLTGPADFDPSPGIFNLIPNNINNLDYADIFISKSGSCALPYPLTQIVSPTAACQWSEIQISVNTSYGAESYNWELPDGSSYIDGIYTNQVTLQLGTVSGVISVVPANSCGYGPSTSINITVDSLPIILDQPVNRVIDENSSTSFTTNCYGSNLIYKWQKETAGVYGNLSNNATYSGTSTNTLNVNNCSLSLNGTNYRCVITNGTCRDTTNEVLLTVNDTIGVPNSIGNFEPNSLLQIYPSVSDGSYMVQNDLVGGNLVYSVFDIAGRIINSGMFLQGYNQLNLKNDAAGVYFLKVSLPKEVQTIRLLKTE